MKRLIAMVIVFLMIICCFSACTKQQHIVIDVSSEEIGLPDQELSSELSSLDPSSQDQTTSNTPNSNNGNTVQNNQSNTTVNSTQGTTNSKPNNTPTGNNTMDKDQATTTSKQPQIDTSVNIGTQTDIDFEGKTIILASWSNTLAPKETSKTYEQETELIRQIEQKYNCKIDYTRIEDSIQYYSTFCTQTMAGTKFADIAKLPGDQAFPDAALKGYTRCLEGKFDWNNEMFAKKYNNDVLLLNGKHYYLAFKTEALSLVGNGIKFRKSLFEKFSVVNPYDHVKQNTWTWDTFRDICKAMTRKVGYDQYYGLQNASVMFSSNNVTPIIKTGEGQYRFNLVSTNALECIEFSRILYNDDKVCPTYNNAIDLWNAERVAMAPTSWYNIEDSQDIGFVYYPIGPNASDYVYNSGAMNLMVVPSRVKDSEFDGVCEIIKDFFGAYPWRTSIKDQLDPYAPDETSLNILVDTVERALNGNTWNTYYPWTYSNIIWTDYGISNGTSPRAFIDSVRDKAQAEIDAVWADYSNLQ